MFEMACVFFGSGPENQQVKDPKFFFSGKIFHKTTDSTQKARETLCL